LRDLAVRGVAGGAVYDALVGATAAEHGVPLVSRDARARAAYRTVGADVRTLG
jgi:predicted nucleic acid-binding protein